MKKQHMILILGIIIGSLFSINSVALGDTTLKLVVDGQQVQADCQLINNRSFFPVRLVSSSLGVPDVDVLWDQAKQMVTITKDDRVVQMTIGDNILKVNDQPTVMDVVPTIIAERTYLPIAYIARALGYQVSWVSTNNTIVIDSTVNANNVFTLTTITDFNQGTFDKAVVTKVRDGEVQLAKVESAYAKQGVFTSNIIHTAPFSNLIASWNSDTPVGTAISIEAQVLVNGQWSDWISWGTWSTNQERFSVNDDNNSKLAGIWTDSLYVKDGKKANAFRLRSILSSPELKATPVLRAVSATLDLGSGAQRVYPADENIAAIEKVDRKLNVPAFSQFIRDPQIADSICSPTSATCVVDYYLEKYKQPGVLPEESAYAIYDSVYEGFGNWSFGASYMGSFGLNSRVEFGASLYDLKREIYNERPVIISVNYARNENNTDPEAVKFPLLHGFPILATEGHLITVTGFTKIDGKEYVCVNDSSAANDAEAKRMYLADEFDAAWATSGRVAYTTNDLDGIVYNPLLRRPAALKKTNNIEKIGAQEYSEYQLICDGNIIDISNANVKTIMVSKDGRSYQYITPDLKTNLWFTNNTRSSKYTFVFIAKDDKEYTVTATL